MRPLCRQAATAVSRFHRLCRLGIRATPSFAQLQRLFHRRAWSQTGGRIRPPGSQSLQDLQRFHSVKTTFYLCSAIEKRSCRPTDRTAVYEAVNGGSNPVGTTDWGIVQRPVRRTLTPEAQVRVLVPRQDWSFGRRGVCVGLKIRRTWFNSARLRTMVIVAQSARVPDCGSGGRGFEPLHSPQGNIAQR